MTSVSLAMLLHLQHAQCVICGCNLQIEEVVGHAQPSSSLDSHEPSEAADEAASDEQRAGAQPDATSANNVVPLTTQNAQVCGRKALPTAL